MLMAFLRQNISNFKKSFNAKSNKFFNIWKMNFNNFFNVSISAELNVVKKTSSKNASGSSFSLFKLLLL